MAAPMTCLKKRDLLHNPNASAEELKRLGKEYLEDGRAVDALDFFEKAGDREGITRIRDVSLEQGDTFLLQQTAKLLQEPLSEKAWRTAGEKALGEGRFRQALTAFQALGDEQKIEEIQAQLGA
ncbi:MAG: hypothetical protein AB1585_17985 [Thermodesulfobacteriota bacterium]